jgi:hypothetical protein
MFYDEHNPPHLHAEYQGKKPCLIFTERSSKAQEIKPGLFINRKTGT